jgi:hypothetical protein
MARLRKHETSGRAKEIGSVDSTEFTRLAANGTLLVAAGSQFYNHPFVERPTSIGRPDFVTAKELA